MSRLRLVSNPSAGPLALGLLLGGASLLLVSPTAGPAVDAQSPSGSDLYSANCASCHQAGGEGIVGTFPPLLGNPAAADAAYVESVVRDGLSGPTEVLGETYDGVMPPVAGLTDPEIAAVVDYVVDLAGPPAASDEDPTSTEPEPAGDATSDEEAGAVVGDADRGRQLFLGSRGLDAGTPACGSCHTAGSVGDYGGAVLGPDLTASYETLGGEAGLTGWLANPPTETMAAVFAERPMTEAEVADVVAFLAEAPSEERPDGGFGRVVAAVVVGLVVAFGLMAVSGARARRPYVAKLRSAR